MGCGKEGEEESGSGLWVRVSLVLLGVSTGCTAGREKFFSRDCESCVANNTFHLLLLWLVPLGVSTLRPPSSVAFVRRLLYGTHSTIHAGYIYGKVRILVCKAEESGREQGYGASETIDDREGCRGMRSSGVGFRAQLPLIN